MSQPQIFLNLQKKYQTNRKKWKYYTKSYILQEFMQCNSDSPTIWTGWWVLALDNEVDTVNVLEENAQAFLRGLTIHSRLLLKCVVD
jgi:hypothetical protein